MMADKDAQEFERSVGEGLKYPWTEASRLWNILWAIIPFFGWFAVLGYVKIVVRSLIIGKRKALPAFGSFWENFKQGIIVFVFLIPTFIALFALNFIPFIGNALSFLANIFFLPWLVMNFFIHETFDSLWDIQKAFNIVFDNAKDYIYAYLKTLIFVLVYAILSFILIGIPCLLFGKFYFLTEFYKRYSMVKIKGGK